MNENPKISVIIPVYNVEKYLRECLGSVINQTLKDIEIIIVDDGSTDNSPEICDEYASKDNRIKVIHQKNAGVSVARNKGLDIATGEYIGFVDSDDWIDLDFYEKLYKKAIETNADIVRAQRQYIDYDGNIKEGILNERIIATKNKWYFSYEFTTAIYKNSIIKENNISFPDGCILGEDNLFLHFVIEKINTLEIINDTNYYYKRRKDSAFSSVLSYEKILCGLGIYQKILGNTNKMYKAQTIDTKSYILLYKHFLNALRYFFKADSKENRKLCVEYFISFYNDCLEKQEYDKYLFKQFPIIAKNIINNNSKKLYKTLSKFKNFDEFMKKNFSKKHKVEIKDIKQKIIYLIYIILLKLGIKDFIKKALQKVGYKFDD